jgi:N-acyl-phosphatidylethanolamine-hydrolysing phospholipase D
VSGHGERAHHRPGGGFRIPWPVETERAGGFLRWQLDRVRNGRPGPPPAGALAPVRSRHALPRADDGELRVTWVGHATFLLQLGRANLLTDPVWSRRASPVPWLGPARLTEPGLPFDELPPIDAVLLSHDHFDHLDRPTVRRLHERFGDALLWIAPLGYTAWLGGLGIRRVAELDWWQSVRFTAAGQELDVVALPAQHWTRRSLVFESDRLWASFAIRAGDAGRVYFAGDSGYFGGFREIGRRLAPFDAALLPIGAYEPRWFMRPAHMNPEEAVRAYQDLGSAGTFVGMHWGTFQLTDEPVLEPPERARAAWCDAGLPASALWLPRHGETRVLREPARPTR